ncbi:hypothetical protein BN2537_6223 [Streptomyces venezuelae]|nr:hypothetical protein BN2537_6223 [Streptomyces venezuelae]
MGAARDPLGARRPGPAAGLRTALAGLARARVVMIGPIGPDGSTAAARPLRTAGEGRGPRGPRAWGLWLPALRQARPSRG